MLIRPTACRHAAPPDPADAETESGPAMIAGRGAVHLLEGIEDSFQFVRGDTRAGIPYRDLYTGIAVNRGDHYLSMVSELYGVADQIEENLL